MARAGRTQRNAELDRLLAHGAFSGPEKDRVLSRVLAQTGARKPMWRPVAAALAVAASAAVVLLAVPFLGQDPPTPGGQPSDPANELRAKGLAESGPSIEIGCHGPCAPGATLMVRVGGLARRAHLTAFALRSDHRRIWYWPAIDQTSPEVAASSAPTVLSQGVLLGPEHSAGRYQVYLWLTSKPLRRGDVDAHGKLRRKDVEVYSHLVRRLDLTP